MLARHASWRRRLVCRPAVRAYCVPCWARRRILFNEDDPLDARPESFFAAFNNESPLPLAIAPRYPLAAPHGRHAALGLLRSLHRHPKSCRGPSLPQLRRSENTKLIRPVPWKSPPNRTCKTGVRDIVHAALPTAVKLPTDCSSALEGLTPRNRSGARTSPGVGQTRLHRSSRLCAHILDPPFRGGNV